MRTLVAGHPKVVGAFRCSVPGARLCRRPAAARGYWQESGLTLVSTRCGWCSVHSRAPIAWGYTALVIGFLLAATLNAASPPAKVVNDGYGDFMHVPAGPFEMGDNFGDGESRERPVHTVTLDAYYIGKFEVTNGEWRKFRDDPGYDDPKFWPDGSVMPKEQIPYWTQAQNHGGGLPANDDYPVLGVNWDGATAYCNWLSAKTGKKYRLPTEAEWEKAARGTDQRKFPWGNQIDQSYANFVGSQRYDTGQLAGYYDGSKRGDFQTHNGASPYGVHDMAGNVMEWCQDWYSRDYYSVSPKKNPKGPENGAYRVVRGGTFFMEAQDQRTYLRSASWPSVQTHRMTGFRAVREP